MPEVIVFPDVEAVVVSYLNTQFAARSETARASTKVPAPRPAKFVRVLRTGGSSSLVEDRAQLTIEAWATTAVAANALMQLTRGLMHAIDQVTYLTVTYQFYRPQEFSGPANRPDPDSGMERYTETFSVGVRGTAV
jgi:hypothetical protein